MPEETWRIVLTEEFGDLGAPGGGGIANQELLKEIKGLKDAIQEAAKIFKDFKDMRTAFGAGGTRTPSPGGGGGGGGERRPRKEDTPISMGEAFESIARPIGLGPLVNYVKQLHSIWRRSQKKAGEPEAADDLRTAAQANKEIKNAVPEEVVETTADANRETKDLRDRARELSAISDYEQAVSGGGAEAAIGGIQAVAGAASTALKAAAGAAAGGAGAAAGAGGGAAGGASGGGAGAAGGAAGGGGAGQGAGAAAVGGGGDILSQILSLAPMIMIIGTTIGLLWGAVKKSKVFSTMMDSLLTILSAFIDIMLVPLMPIFAWVLKFLAGKLPLFLKIADFVGKFFENPVEAILEALSAFGTWLLDQLKKIISGFIDFEKLEKFFTETLPEIAGKAWDLIKGAALTAWEGIQTAGEAIWGFIQTAGEAIWSGIQTAGEAIWSGIQTAGEAIWGFIQTAGEGIWSFIQTAGEGIWSFIQTAGESIWSGIETVGKSIWSGIETAGKGIWSFIQTAGEAIWNPIKDVASGIWDKVVDLLKSALSHLPVIGHWFSDEEEQETTPPAGGWPSTGVPGLDTQITNPPPATPNVPPYYQVQPPPGMSPEEFFWAEPYLIQEAQEAYNDVQADIAYKQRIHQLTNQYQSGAAFIPKNEMAMLHKGEAVIPEAVNKMFSFAGGALNFLQKISEVGFPAIESRVAMAAAPASAPATSPAQTTYNRPISISNIFNVQAQEENVARRISSDLDKQVRDSWVRIY